MEILGKTWHSSKFIFLEMGPNNIIEGGESENRGPRARISVFYTTINDDVKIRPFSMLCRGT